MTKEDTAEPSDKPVPLHPAYSVSNIQSKIRTLDGTTVTYSAWVKLFRLHAVAYKVSDHIDGTPPPAATSPEYAQWKEIDALVLQWIYSTVSDNNLKRLMDTTMAREAWTKLEKVFLSNKKARAAALETRFCNLTLTACSSVDDYCQQLSDLASQLADVDQPVSDSRLVLQLVRGLPPEYNTTASLINQQGVDWDQAITMLNDEVLRIEAQKGSQPTVLAAVAAPASAAPSSANQQPPDAAYSSNRRGSRGRNNNSSRRGRGRGRQQSPWSGYPGQPAFPSWAWWTPPPCPYPTQQQWSGSKQPDSNSIPQVQSIIQTWHGTRMLWTQALSLMLLRTKDLKTRKTLSRHNSTGTLYTFTPPQLPPQATFITSHHLPWHDRLGHPGAQVFDILNRNFNFQCNKDCSSHLCNSCQLSNNKRLPFYSSNTYTFAPFDIIHCDLWTSPITSKTGYKYYMVLTDNFSHFVWVYPLKYKSETFPTFAKFHQLILTQFNRKIKTFQCDLGG
ncbi:putative RNA-directed DNA polymerase [Helianthus annuus]|nr:putative RNA-directed DNA polymerase [Helianthus annuus]